MRPTANGKISTADAMRETTSGHSPESCPARARKTKYSPKPMPGQAASAMTRMPTRPCGWSSVVRETSTTATMPITMPIHAAVAGRSPIPTPTITGTIAASTAVTGEIMFIGAVTISWYMIETPTSPHAPPRIPNRTTRAVSVPGKSGSIAAISTAPTG